jgi:hypothetical protein
MTIKTKSRTKRLVGQIIRTPEGSTPGVIRCPRSTGGPKATRFLFNAKDAGKVLPVLFSLVNFTPKKSARTSQFWARDLKTIAAPVLENESA